MLTRAQIQRLAQRHGIDAQAQERDYIQHLLLFLLYQRPPYIPIAEAWGFTAVYG